MHTAPNHANKLLTSRYRKGASRRYKSPGVDAARYDHCARWYIEAARAAIRISAEAGAVSRDRSNVWTTRLAKKNGRGQTVRRAATRLNCDSTIALVPGVKPQAGG
jgi:hypothetical protein